MDNALYVGLSRQMTLRRQLDIVANNIANADTTGFKARTCHRVACAGGCRAVGVGHSPPPRRRHL